jgi:hypothetical protein
MDTSITLLAPPRKKIERASNGIELARAGMSKVTATNRAPNKIVRRVPILVVSHPVNNMERIAPTA